jgi:hypothetical protein
MIGEERANFFLEELQAVMIWLRDRSAQGRAADQTGCDRSK